MIKSNVSTFYNYTNPFPPKLKYSTKYNTIIKTTCKNKIYTIFKATMCDLKILYT